MTGKRKTDERVNFDERRFRVLVSKHGGDRGFRDRCIELGIITPKRTLGHRTITPETFRKGLSSGLLNRSVLEKIGLKFENDESFFFETKLQEHNRLTQYFRSPNVFNGWLPGVSKEKKLTGLSSHSVIDDYQLPNMYARFSQWLPFVGTSDLFWNESRFLLSCLVEFSTHQLMGNPERLRVNHHNRLLDSALSQIALMKKRANDEQLIELLVIRGQLNRKRVPGKFTCWDKDDPNPDASQKKAALHQKAIKDFKRAQALARKLDDRSMEAKIESIIHHEMMALARVLAKRGTPKDLRASVDIQRKFPGFLSMYEQSEDLTMPQPILSTKFDLVASIALAKDGQVREALATLNQCKSRLVMNNIQNNRLEHSAVLLAWKIGSAHGIRTNDSPTTGSDELERAMNYFNSESPTQLDCFVEVPSVVAHLDGHSS